MNKEGFTTPTTTPAAYNFHTPQTTRDTQGFGHKETSAHLAFQIIVATMELTNQPLTRHDWNRIHNTATDQANTIKLREWATW